MGFARTDLYFGAFADADLALLEQGWHLAYCRLSHLYGCPYAAGQMEAFRAWLTAKYGLAPKQVLLVSGDADLDVPFEENGAVLERTYRAHGGTVTTILKPGGGHHPHSLPDVTPIMQFVLSSAANRIQ
ncbi:hypothetical protein U9M73_00680 [Paenibacillus phoenicis]|uniref:Peptidase S9 prolyl oligopeptidase catalytic domain-containing protein n=1 Tax=Paenibacillus phoenicis TaxID=554117 RepID=A0ABU5PF14_9BACL|nr:hypothetical protein [Paenibacillus phoenicis]MEA3568514.1 hypothetical protein [Paenibacillus phoenicis]